MRILIAVAALTAATLLQGCVSYSPDVPPGYNLGAPEETIYYLRWALEKDYPLHVHNCLSRGFIERNDASATNVEFFYERVKETILNYVGGSLEDVRVADRRVLEPGVALVTLVSGPHRAVVRMIREVSWEISPSDPDAPPIQGVAGSMTEITDYDGKEVVIRLPVPDAPITPQEIHRLDVDNSWRIDAVKHNLEELEAELRAVSKD